MKKRIALGLLFCAACVSKTSPTPEPHSEISGESQGPAATSSKALIPTPPSAPSRTELPAAAPTPSPALAPPSAEVDLKAELSTLPQEVLVGTDVAPLAQFARAATSIPATGSFYSEQGGATAEVRLEAAAAGTTLVREFAEPGAKPQVRRYEALRSHAAGARLSGKDLEVLGAGQSILVLEKGSGVDGIPDSLWIQYELESSKASTQGE